MFIHFLVQYISRNTKIFNYLHMFCSHNTLTYLFVKDGVVTLHVSYCPHTATVIWCLLYQEIPGLAGYHWQQEKLITRSACLRKKMYIGDNKLLTLPSLGCCSMCACIKGSTHYISKFHMNINNDISPRHFLLGVWLWHWNLITNFFNVLT